VPVDLCAFVRGSFFSDSIFFVLFSPESGCNPIPSALTPASCRTPSSSTLPFHRQCFGSFHRTAVGQPFRLHGEHGLRFGVRLSDDCYRSVAVWKDESLVAADLKQAYASDENSNNEPQSTSWSSRIVLKIKNDPRRRRRVVVRPIRISRLSNHRPRRIAE